MMLIWTDKEVVSPGGLRGGLVACSQRCVCATDEVPAGRAAVRDAGLEGGARVEMLIECGRTLLRRGT